MLKLVLNVKYSLLLSFLTAAEFYNLGPIQGIIQGMSCEGACAHAHVRCAVAHVRVRAK